MSYQHGIGVDEIRAAAASLAVIATGVIGLVATGPAADAAAFPLNQRVEIPSSGIKDAIAKAGATGTLKRALEAIASQVRTPIVVVRVAPGVASQGVTVQQATDANVVAAIQLLRGADTQLAKRPRILGAPGLDTEPVAIKLAEVAKKLRAMAYAYCNGATLAERVTYRDKFTQRELMLIVPDFLAPQGVLGEPAPSYAVAHALGLRARIDAEQGWHKTLSNVPLNDVVGTTQDIEFDYESTDTEANQLNEAGITTIVRINGQLRFWGNRTCADPANDDTKDFQFESFTRTAQILASTVAQGMIWAIDKPLTPGLARDIVEKINELFRKLKRPGFILGADCWFDPDQNPVAQLREGKLRLRYRYTPVPPLENLQLQQEITDEFLADFAQLVTAA